MTPARILFLTMFGALVGCAASTPAATPVARGRITSRGGALGDWELVVDRCTADDTRVLTVDLHGGGSYHRKRYVRVTRVAADEDGTPTIDVELVDTKAKSGPLEVVVDPALASKPAAPGVTGGVSTAHCRVADGWIAAEPASHFSGAFRFACDTLDGAKITGSAAFSHCAGDEWTSEGNGSISE